MKIESVQKNGLDRRRQSAAQGRARAIQRHAAYEQLVAAGECDGEPVPIGAYLDVGVFLHDLRKAREDAGLSLTDVEKRTGIDKATLSAWNREANQPDGRYTGTLCGGGRKQLVLTLQDMPKTS